MMTLNCEDTCEVHFGIPCLKKEHVSVTFWKDSNQVLPIFGETETAMLAFSEYYF